MTVQRRAPGRTAATLALGALVAGLLGGCVREQTAADATAPAPTRTTTVWASSPAPVTSSASAAPSGASPTGGGTGTTSSTGPSAAASSSSPTTTVPAPDAAPPRAAGAVGIPAAARERPSRGGVVLAPTGRGALDGRRVVVDPGHNGAQQASIINRQVPAGHGRTKPCNTTGTADVAGRPEHEFTWATGQLLVAELRGRGATVVLTRPDDRGVGPCVDERARIGNTHGADLVLSIHADGNLAASARGFHVIVAEGMAGGPAVGSASRRLAAAAARALQDGAGMRPASYIGGGTGIVPRDDIAGLTLSQVPAIMLEAGNMRQPQDAALLHDPARRSAIARALADAAETSLR